MNNLLKVFQIKVAGTNLDDKMYNQYEDYDSSDATTAPTDDNTKDKSIAYLRWQHLSRKLSELAVPVFETIKYATPGTAKTIPTDATIDVGYISYDALLQTYSVEDQAAWVTDEDKENAAASALQTIINNALKGDGTNALVQETVSVQKTVSRMENALTPTNVDFIEYENLALDVPAVSDASVVTYIKL